MNSLLRKPEINTWNFAKGELPVHKDEISIQIKCRKCDWGFLFYGIGENIKQKINQTQTRMTNKQKKKKKRKNGNKKILNKRNRKNQSINEKDWRYTNYHPLAHKSAN